MFLQIQGKFIISIDAECSRLIRMRLFQHGSGGKLQCPYKGCEKRFDKPTVVTDTTAVPRTTHYACPFCMSKVQLVTQKEKVVGLKATEYPTVFDSPAKCAHFSGSLDSFPSDSPLPDECLICPKALQCTKRRR